MRVYHVPVRVRVGGHLYYVDVDVSSLDARARASGGLRLEALTLVSILSSEARRARAKTGPARRALPRPRPGKDGPCSRTL